MLSTTARLKLAGFTARATHLHMFSAPSFRENLIAGLAAVADEGETSKANAAEFGKLVRRAHEGDLDARSQLNGLVIETVNNYVVASMNWGRFFEIRTLADNESPAIQNNTRQEIKAGYVAQDGSAAMTRVIKPQAEQTVDLSTLTSQVVTYRVRDIYTGNVEEAARATFDIAHDLKGKLESILFTLLTDAVGSFDVTNANKASRVYNAHSRIAAGVLPTSNALTATGAGAQTKLAFACFDEVIDYCTRFAGSDSGLDLKPTGEVIVPSQDVREIASGITITSAKQSALAESVVENGWYNVGRYMGIDWRLVPDSTIAQKSCYPILNRPVGILWLKPGMAEVEEKVEKMKNQASRQESMVFGAAIPGPNKRNFVKLTYRT